MRFKKVYIELSDICGLSCSFCPHPKNRRNTMPKILFEKVLQEIRGRTQGVCLHVLGDPCRLGDLGEYLALLKKYQLRVDLVTSGYYLSQKEILVKSPVHQIAFSLDAGYDDNNPKKLDYLDNILDFCNFRKVQNSKTFVNLRIQDTRQNPEVIQKIFDFFGLDQEAQNFSAYQRIKLDEYIFLNITKTFEWANIEAKKMNTKKYCHALREQIAILANGVVTPCCIDATGEIALGNIKEQSLEAIYYSSRAQNILEGFCRGEPREELCKKCFFPAIRKNRF
ncbi:SPASM domain-containing protein [Helicobacter sp. faydin-H20]|uniref:radical SAM/SPASM domain-containing protein n=1 Tax=Helicobacter anatolicus TaxID=2905874 RepID=UPI001E462347|nr:radical SAM/SPASM domain-containing protein [Helicobacter anatolicus]MCE3037432.1 SPASM domain-containing protein [Helicobacter anatolicus]